MTEGDQLIWNQAMSECEILCPVCYQANTESQNRIITFKNLRYILEMDGQIYDLLDL